MPQVRVVDADFDVFSGFLGIGFFSGVFGRGAKLVKGLCRSGAHCDVMVHSAFVRIDGGLHVGRHIH